MDEKRYLVKVCDANEDERRYNAGSQKLKNKIATDSQIRCIKICESVVNKNSRQ